MFWTRTSPADPPQFGSGANARALELVRSPRARQMRLSVDPRTGAVKLTLPPRAPLKSALAWAETKRDWVEAQLARQPAPAPIVPGMAFMVAGQTLVLDWNPAHRRQPRIVGDRLEVGGPIEQMPARLLRWLKAEARALLAAETLEYAAICGVDVERVSIGDPVSRWGSCSASGAIRYSWRLILAPAHVRRATVAHEVAHRVHMNHGREFHALVAKIYGSDPKPARLWFRAHGTALHGFGG